MTDRLNQVSQAVLKCSTLLLTSHESPDCDALGSMLALGSGLSSIGKKVEMYSSGKVPGYLNFLPGWEKVITDPSILEEERYDLIVLLDCADVYRPGKVFGEFVAGLREKKLIIIDHHFTNNGGGDLSLIDHNAACTGVLVYKLLRQCNVEISKEIANCLLSTIIGDTGSFRYSNTNSEAFKISGDLLETGADLTMVSRSIYENEPLRKIKLISEAISTLEVDDTSKVASIYVDESMYKKTGTTKEDTEGIVNIARSINGVSVGVFFKQDCENSSVNTPSWRVSLRSKYDVDVSRIARTFGGGGHVKAAGLSIEGSIKSVKNRVLQSVKEAVR